MILKLPNLGREARVNTLIGCGHFLSHYYQLCLPPLFIAWQHAFGVSFAELGLAMALLSGTGAVVQAPIGFLVDRYGARRFLVGGTLLMTLSMAAMSLAASFWQIMLLAMLSGLGNSVFHPADYAILSGSIERSRIGRAFALHTFVGQVGFAVSPPLTAALMVAIGWRGALAVVGLLGIPVVLAILWQSRILVEEKREARHSRAGLAGDLRQLFSRSILSFFAFFMVSAMAGAAVQAWLITILHRSHGLSLAAASSALTSYMTGMMIGVLIGGRVAERTDRHLGFVVATTVIGAAVLLWVNLVAMPEIATIAVMLLGGLAFGARNTPRDVMVKDAAAPGQIGKVFGFVSAGMMLGSAIMPMPYGMLIDAGHPQLVLTVAAGLAIASLVFAGNARTVRHREPVAVAAE